MPECTGSRFPVLDTLPQEVLKAAKDAAYIGIGFAVLGAKQANDRVQQLRADAQRQSDERKAAAEDVVGKLNDATREAVQDLGGTLKTGVQDLGGTLRTGVKDVDARIAPIAGKVDQLLDQWESSLPEAARTQVARAREAARKANADLRERLGLADDPATAAA